MKYFLALFLALPILAQTPSAYTKQVIADPYFAGWLSTNGVSTANALADTFGAVADATNSNGVWLGTDNTSAIQTCLAARGACYLTSGKTYGIKGYIVLHSGDTFGTTSDSKATIVKLDDTNINHLTPGATNGLLNWGSIWSDTILLTPTTVQSSNVTINNIVFDCNGGRSHRRVINGPATFTDDGTYTPGTVALWIGADNAIVRNCDFKNFATWSCVKTQTFTDWIGVGTTNVARLPVSVSAQGVALPELFPVYFQIEPGVAWPTSTNWTWRQGPTITGNRFFGPLRPQEESLAYIPDITNQITRPEITLLTVTGVGRYTVQSSSSTSVTNGGFVTNTILITNAAYNVLQGFANANISDNEFYDFNCWNTSPTNKQLAPIHLITAGYVKGLTVAKNTANNCDAAFFYTDNGPIIGGSINENNGRNVLGGISFNGGSYAAGLNRYSAQPSWVVDLSVVNNEFSFSGYQRLSAQYQTVGTAQALGWWGSAPNTLQSYIGQNGYVWPYRWRSMPGVPTNSVADINGTLITSSSSTSGTNITITTTTFFGDDAYPVTATEPVQSAIYQNVQFRNNKFVGYPADVLDNNLYIPSVFRVNMYMGYPQLESCVLTRNIIDTLSLSGNNFIPNGSGRIQAVQLLSDPAKLVMVGNINTRGGFITAATTDPVLFTPQSDDPVYSWSTQSPLIITTNTRSATYFDYIQPDSSNMVYLASNYRGIARPDGLTTNAIPMAGTPNFIYSSGPTNLVLPYPDSRISSTVYYDGNCPIGLLLYVRNFTTNTITIYSPANNSSRGISFRGLIKYGGTDTTNGVAITNGAALRFVADADGHYTAVSN